MRGSAASLPGRAADCCRKSDTRGRDTPVRRSRTQSSFRRRRDQEVPDPPIRIPRHAEERHHRRVITARPTVRSLMLAGGRLMRLGRFQSDNPPAHQKISSIIAQNGKNSASPTSTRIIHFGVSRESTSRVHGLGGRSPPRPSAAPSARRCG